MSIHRLVKKADIEVINNEKEAFNPLMEVSRRISKNAVECKMVNDGYVSDRKTYGSFSCVESRLRKVPYVTVRVTNAQMKVVINNINDKHRKVKLNYSEPLLNFEDLFYKSSKTPPPYLMLYTNRHRIFIDVKALWWLDGGIVITYDVL